MAVSCKINKNANDAPDALASHIDSTANPADDFFQYANGKWFKQNPVPADENSNGIFQIIEDTVKAQVQSICISASSLKNAEKGSLKQKIGDFYFSGMDSISINEKGITPLNPELEKIKNIKDITGIINEAANLHVIACAPLFSFTVVQDDKNSSRYVVNILQGGISLPNREFYLANDQRAKTIRISYKEHLSHSFKILGNDEKFTKKASEDGGRGNYCIWKTGSYGEDLYKAVRFKRAYYIL